MKQIKILAKPLLLLSLSGWEIEFQDIFCISSKENWRGHQTIASSIDYFFGSEFIPVSTTHTWQYLYYDQMASPKTFFGGFPSCIYHFIGPLTSKCFQRASQHTKVKISHTGNSTCAVKQIKILAKPLLLPSLSGWEIDSSTKGGKGW